MSRFLIPKDKELGKIFKDELVKPGPYFPYQSLKNAINIGKENKTKEVKFNNNIVVREKENIFENIVETGEDVVNVGKGVSQGTKDVIDMGAEGAQVLVGTGSENVNEIIESSGNSLKELINKNKELIGNNNDMIEGYANSGSGIQGAPIN